MYFYILKTGKCIWPHFLLYQKQVELGMLCLSVTFFLIVIFKVIWVLQNLFEEHL